MLCWLAHLYRVVEHIKLNCIVIILLSNTICIVQSWDIFCNSQTNEVVVYTNFSNNSFTLIFHIH